jgi:hypothetical protein
MSRSTGVERGAPEQQLAVYQRGNNTQEDNLLSKMSLNKKKFGILLYNIIRKWEIWVKKGELR